MCASEEGERESGGDVGDWDEWDWKSGRYGMDEGDLKVLKIREVEWVFWIGPNGLRDESKRFKKWFKLCMRKKNPKLFKVFKKALEKHKSLNRFKLLENAPKWFRMLWRDSLMFQSCYDHSNFKKTPPRDSQTHAKAVFPSIFYHITPPVANYQLPTAHDPSQNLSNSSSTIICHKKFLSDLTTLFNDYSFRSFIVFTCVFQGMMNCRPLK
jgi:hypothetical protein